MRSSRPVRTREITTGSNAAIRYHRSGTRHIVSLASRSRHASRPLVAAVTNAATAGPNSATSATYTDAPVYGRSAHVNAHARMKNVARRERIAELSVLPPTIGKELRHALLENGQRHRA